MSKILAELSKCSKLFERLVDRVASTYAFEERVEAIYQCGSRVVEKIKHVIMAETV